MHAIVASNRARAHHPDGEVRTYLIGATLFFVACSNAYASSINRGSLHASPVKLTPNGEGCASNPAGNAGVGALGTRPNGTITVGNPGFAAIAAPVGPGNRIA